MSLSRQELPGERSADSVPALLASSGASVLEHPSVIISLFFGISLERSS